MNEKFLPTQIIKLLLDKVVYFIFEIDYKLVTTFILVKLGVTQLTYERAKNHKIVVQISYLVVLKKMCLYLNFKGKKIYESK